MDAFQVLQNAKRLVSTRLTSAPDFTIFQSIDAQLDYVEKVLRDSSADRSRLKDINVGLYAVREFEESDPEFAEELKKVQYIVDRKIKGLKI